MGKDRWLFDGVTGIDRGIRLVQTLTGLDRAASSRLLDAAEGRVKIAAIMHAHEVDAAQAEVRLTNANGVLRRALK